MRKLVLCIIATTMLAGCASEGDTNRPRDEWRGYDNEHPDPAYGGYEADRYYRQNRDSARERELSQDERVYRGRDGRYYCKRSDGTTGLIVGAIAGGVLGDAIAPGGSGLLGALIGGSAGAVAGQAIDSHKMRCR